MVVGFEVGDVDDGVWLFVDGEYRLVEAVVEVLEHGVEVGVFGVYGEELLDASYALEAHVLCDFDGVGAPGCYCFAASADEESWELLGVDWLRSAEEPREFQQVVVVEGVVGLDCENVFCSEEYYHLCLLGFEVGRRRRDIRRSWSLALWGYVCGYEVIWDA